MTHEDYMKRAMALAAQGRGRTAPNPMVGCVIVKNGKVIAEGWHKRCGDDHAEIVALKTAGTKAYGATMYVTLEPCAHFGRTPPCVDDIIAAGIRDIFIGMRDPNPLTNGRSIRRMKKAGIRVRAGLLEKDLHRLNENFVKYITTGYPFVVAKIAQTLDGKTATANGRSQWITSDATRQLAHRLRRQFDAICVGSGTVLSDDPQLNAAGTGRQLKKIVIDSSLSLPLNARLFRGMKKSDVIIATTRRAPSRKMRLMDRKAVILVSPSQDGKVDLKWLFKELPGEGITSVLMEGGGTLIGGALKAGLVDKFWIFMAPKIFGDQDALSSVRGLTCTDVERALTVRQMSVQRLGNDLFLEAYV